MAGTVTLANRFPDIIAELEVRAELVTHQVAEDISENAARRAVMSYAGEDPFAIHSGEADEGHGVYAHWYWIFGEFGTKHQPSRPFMMPAVEMSTLELVALARVALADL